MGLQTCYGETGVMDFDFNGRSCDSEQSECRSGARAFEGSTNGADYFV